MMIIIIVVIIMILARDDARPPPPPTTIITAAAAECIMAIQARHSTQFHSGPSTSTTHVAAVPFKLNT